MVRLVFRPYTQIRRTICTSVSLRASTRGSPGFTLCRHRSPSFGSQQICSYSNPAQARDRSIMPLTVLTSVALDYLYFHCASWVLHPNTRTYVRLLGPCFKTGRMKPFCHRIYVREMLRMPTPLSTRPAGHEQLEHCDQTYRYQFRHEFCQALSLTAGKLPCPWSFPQV